LTPFFLNGIYNAVITRTKAGVIVQFSLVFIVILQYVVVNVVKKYRRCKLRNYVFFLGDEDGIRAAGIFLIVFIRIRLSSFIEC
jgi:hypothetical protein